MWINDVFVELTMAIKNCMYCIQIFLFSHWTNFSQTFLIVRLKRVNSIMKRVKTRLWSYSEFSIMSTYSKFHFSTIS